MVGNKKVFSAIVCKRKVGRFGKPHLESLTVSSVRVPLLTHSFAKTSWKRGPQTAPVWAMGYV